MSTGEKDASTESAGRGSPRLWLVTLGGVMLAAIAGGVNVVVLVSAGVPVTHVTGSITRATADLELGDRLHAGEVTAVVMAFGAGAMLSGLILGGQVLKLGRRYGVTMMIEGLLLGAAAWLLAEHRLAAVLLAAGSAGLQNAMASSFNHLILRTTHVTGVLTDLGFLLGRRLRGARVETWRIWLLFGLLGGFVVGGVAGSVAHERLGPGALWVPAGLLLGVGGGYWLWRHRADVRERRGRAVGGLEAGGGGVSGGAPAPVRADGA